MRRYVTPLATPIVLACSNPYLKLPSALESYLLNMAEKQRLVWQLHFIEHSIIIGPSEPHI